MSNEIFALIKKKPRLRRQYSQNKNPAVKTRINQLQKQVKDQLKVESLVGKNSATPLAWRTTPMSLITNLRTSLS